MANDKFLKEIGDKLRDHSSDVNPQIWQGVSSHIGGVSSGFAGGLGFAKIAGIAVFIVSTGMLMYYGISKEKEKSETTPQINTAITNNEKVSLNKRSAPVDDVSEIKRIESTRVKQTSLAQTNLEIIELAAESQSGINSLELIIPMAPEPILTMSPGGQKSVFQSDESQTSIKEIKTLTPLQSQSEETVMTKAQLVNLPNIFTPNNDGANDFFFVEIIGLVNYSLVVLDEKNNVVWKTNNPNEKWDGVDLGGEKVPNGSYLYFITAEDEMGNNVNEHRRLQIQ